MQLKLQRYVGQKLQFSNNMYLNYTTFSIQYREPLTLTCFEAVCSSISVKGSVVSSIDKMFFLFQCDSEGDDDKVRRISLVTLVIIQNALIYYLDLLNNFLQ